MRVQSDKPAKNGGWIHRLKDAPRRQEYVKPVKPPPAPTFDARRMMDQLRAQTTIEQIKGHALQLGVDAAAIDGLGAAWSHVHQAWAWPMFDALGNAIGIRLRNEAGDKWAVKGSRQGLFYDTLLAPGPERVLYLCEGPTDTAAAMTLGLPACGRAACQGQVEQVRLLCKARGFSRIIVIADNDDAKQRPDGTVWYPGQEGARRFAAEIGIWVKLIIPPFKDLRQWLRNGANRATLDCIVNQQIWRTA